MIDIATVEKYDRINELTMLLNYYRDQYYNYAKSEISDYEYDNLYDELKKLEDETGIDWQILQHNLLVILLNLNL